MSVGPSFSNIAELMEFTKALLEVRPLELFLYPNGQS